IIDFEFSPDGKTIAFTMRDPAKEEDFRIVGANPRPSRIHLLDVASRKAAPLTAGNDSFSNLSWSPDGSAIAAERESQTMIQDFQNSDIVLVSRGGEVRPIVSWAGADRNPLFSPDGKSIAFLSCGGVSDWLREQQVYVVRAEGGTPRLVSKEYDRTPDEVRWLDSQTILFDGPWNTTSEIFRVGADGRGFRDTTHFEGVISGVDVRGGVEAFVMQSLTAPPELYGSTVSNFQPKQLSHHND